MIARILAAGLLAGLCCLNVSAQPSLSDMVREASAEWMFGNWVAETDSGEKVQLNISWDLDKHVVLLHVKTPEMESKGYSALDPQSEEVKYVSFDNRGSLGKGTWGMEAEELVLRVEVVSPERNPWKAGLVFTGSPSQGLRVRLHSVGDSGYLAEPARTTFSFKKQTPAPAKK